MGRIFKRAILVGSMLTLPWLAHAAERARPAQVPVTSLAVSPSTALTEGECTRAGGTISQDFHAICLSGKVCSRLDQNSKMHSVCIAKKN
jgi:hypothetical protein